MEIDHIITIALALAGWVFAIFQLCANRKWQKKDRLKEKRYSAYNSFMEKIDSINSTMKTDPASSIFSLTMSFIEELRKGDFIEPEQTMANYGRKILEQTRKSVEPLMIVSNEINSLRLIASPSLLKKLEELKKLTTDLYNEMMLSLSCISGKQLEEFNNLKTVGQQERWQRFSTLNDEIFELMRKEIGTTS